MRLDKVIQKLAGIVDRTDPRRALRGLTITGRRAWATNGGHALVVVDLPDGGKAERDAILDAEAVYQALKEAKGTQQAYLRVGDAYANTRITIRDKHGLIQNAIEVSEIDDQPFSYWLAFPKGRAQAVITIDAVLLRQVLDTVIELYRGAQRAPVSLHVYKNALVLATDLYGRRLDAVIAPLTIGDGMVRPYYESLPELEEKEEKANVA